MHEHTRENILLFLAKFIILHENLVNDAFPPFYPFQSDRKYKKKVFKKLYKPKCIYDLQDCGQNVLTIPNIQKTK